MGITSQRKDSSPSSQFCHLRVNSILIKRVLSPRETERKSQKARCKTGRKACAYSIFIKFIIAERQVICFMDMRRTRHADSLYTSASKMFQISMLKCK